VEATPSGGVVCHDEAGAPSGVLLESAAQQAWSTAPEPTPAQWRAMIPKALQDLTKHGFTEVHDLLAPPWLGPMLAEMDRAGELSMTVRLYAPITALKEEIERARGYSTGRVSMAGGKIFADGTINSRTAWMIHEYPDPLPGLMHGKAMMTRAEIGRAIEATARMGVELAVHAIGDGAVRAALDAADDAGRSLGRRPSHVRVEHCEFVDEDDVPRFQDLGVTVSVQPCHLLADIEALRRYFPHRLERVLPVRDLIEAGLKPGRTLLFGSDVPVVRPDPGDSVRAAVFRRREGQDESQAIALGQAITEAQAWACFKG
jgi:predicted amidohydrolase YtcJ